MAVVLQWGVGDADNQLTTEIQRDALDQSALGVLQSDIGFKGAPQQPFSFLVDTPTDLAALYPTTNLGGVTNFLRAFEDPEYTYAMRPAVSSATTWLIRVGMEELVIYRVRNVNENRWEVWVGGNRGYRDTAPVAHAIGEPVVFLRGVRTFRRVYQDEAYLVYTTRSGLPYQTRDIFPQFNRINRVSLPPCPAFESIRQGSTYENHSQIQNVIGAFDIHIWDRSRKGVNRAFDDGQKMVLEFYSLDTLIHTITNGAPSSTADASRYGYRKQIIPISVANLTTWLSSRTGAQLKVRAYATLGELKSWQTVEFVVNWRASGTCVGWGCDWGNNHSGEPPAGATGYGYNWGEDYGGP